MCVCPVHCLHLCLCVKVISAKCFILFKVFFVLRCYLSVWKIILVEMISNMKQLCDFCCDKEIHTLVMFSQECLAFVQIAQMFV